MLEKAMLDDLILGLQRLIDRLVRRLRLGPRPAPTRPRLLVVQIDGLSRVVLARALASGHAPFLAHLLKRHGYRLEPMSVGLPTSTPAFQMAALYGVRPDIPGFHYYDREWPGDIHFPRAGHAARVEERHTAGRQGILQGGSAYGCVFTGGAENNLFSFATLMRPTGRGVLCSLSPVVVVTWVFAKSVVLTVVELVRALLRFVADPVQERHGWRWLTIKIGLSVWVRELFTLAVSRDLYMGTPAVYVNYLDYDVAAHAFGPQSRRAMAALKRVDAAIRQVARAARRVPEHQYDLYVLADHGQVHCRPFRTVTGGRRLERWVFDEFLAPADAAAPEARRSGLVKGIRTRRSETGALFQRFVNYIDEDFLRRGDPEAFEKDGVRVISAGPNAFLYVLDTPKALDADALDLRFPGLAEKLSQSPVVGFVLARSEAGPVCFYRGARLMLSEAEPGPFAGREDLAVVIRGITDLMAMPSAGDLVIYGVGAPGGHVSYVPEIGAHAGTAPEEMNTFIMHPKNVTVPLPLLHPLQLYDHFSRYQRQR
jgi:hypothetical protein